MPFIIKLAFRNLLRHKRRTMITAVAIMLMIAMFILIKGFLDGSERQVLSTVTKQSGHIQIHARGYGDEARSLPLDINIHHPDLVLGALRNEHILAATERIRFMTLISNGDKSIGGLGMGIVPIQEAMISDLGSKIVDGSYHLGGNKAVIGYGLAQALHAKPGSLLTLVANTAYGSVNAADIEISGILRTGIAQIDDSAVFIDLKDAQGLLSMQDQSTEITLKLDDSRNTDRVLKSITAGLDPGTLEVQSWREINRAWIGLFDIRAKFFAILMMVVLMVGGTSIFNTIMMAISERTREIGTLLALGLRKKDIVTAFMLEATGIGILGSLAGILLGGSITFYLSINGILLSSTIKEIGIPLADRLYPVLDLYGMLFAFGFGVFIALLSSIFPAMSASRLKPVDALRYV